MCGSDGGPHENSDILDLMNSQSPNFDGEEVGCEGQTNGMDKDRA